MRMNSSAPLRDDSSSSMLSSAARYLPPISLSSLPTIIPHRIRRKFRSTRSKLRSHIAPSTSITSLKTSFSPADTLRSLQTHQWSYYDLQYLYLAVLGVYCLCIILSPGALIKTTIATLLLTSLLLPITRQFFLPALPIIGWVIFWYGAQFIPADYRPPIWVRVLPALENIFYGANLSNILSAHKHTVLDVLAWLPYGITHFGAPVVVSGLMFIFGPPGIVPIFSRSFGYMNLIGVTIQLIFPCSPPWYENKYKLAPANYSMKGSPAGLAAIDKLFGVDMYTSSFTASPLVFGAFPSLHAANATIEALFMSHVFPRLRPLFVLYALWIWWATMYLSHHYAVDLVGGSLLASICYFVAKAKFVPKIQPEKFFRWDYDYVEVGETVDNYAYGLTELDDDFRHHSESDDWSLGESSSFSDGKGSPSTRSPIDDSEGLDGETLASSSDAEKR